MSNRITEKDLDEMVKQLNDALGYPDEPYSERSGQYTPNGNNYHLNYAYGRVGLLQMISDKGTGVREILGSGTKRELFDKIHSMLSGIYLEREESRH